jgi:hypothetical protein
MTPPNRLAQILLAAVAAAAVVIVLILCLVRKPSAANTLVLRAPTDSEPALDLIRAVVEMPVAAFVNAAPPRPSVLRRVHADGTSGDGLAEDTKLTVWAVESDQPGGPPRITGLHSHQPNLPTTLGIISSATLPDYEAQRFIVAIHSDQPIAGKLTLDFS